MIILSGRSRLHYAVKPLSGPPVKRAPAIKRTLSRVPKLTFYIFLYNEPLFSRHLLAFSSLSFFAFLTSFFLSFSFFFSFCWAFTLVGFILVGKVFRKGFSILGLDERKGRWVVENIFFGNFRVNVRWFFAFFSRTGVLDWIVLILVWSERSLHSAQVSGQGCPWALKLMTS